MHPFTFYSLVCNAKLLLYVITLRLNGVISQRQWRVFWSVIEIATVQEMQSKNKNKVPSCTLGWIQELTGIKLLSDIRDEVTHLSTHGLLQFNGDRVSLLKHLDESFIKEHEEQLAEIVGKGRSLSRLIPIPRQLLRKLCRSTARTLHSVVIVSLLRASAFNKYKGVKNEGTIKLAAIQRFTGWSKSAIADAIRYLREKGYLETERPRKAWKLIKHGLFIKIRFSEKQGEKKKPHVEIPSIDLELANFNNIDPNRMQSMRYVLALFYDAIRKGVIQYSEANLLSFFCACYQAKEKKKLGKTQTPERLFSFIVRNGFCDITDATEQAVLPKLKEFKMSHAHLFVF